jgi:excinuclease ABC subunit B
MSFFKLKTKFRPKGDQPKAIKSLVEGFKKGFFVQTLLGVTGSGKTFTMACVIEKLGIPTLVISHNKTLASQLTSEFREFFPNQAVEYFVSYYDYYQPEAYLPTTDTYIEKEAEINEEIDRLRHQATSAVLSRKDVIIVASVSCIYGLGSPKIYKEETLNLKKGRCPQIEKIFSSLREGLIKRLVRLHYVRSEILEAGRFRLRGPILEIMPPHGRFFVRVELAEDKIKKIEEVDPLKRKILRSCDEILIFPARHFLVPEPLLSEALESIEKELEERLKFFKKQKKFLEAERLERRTRYDLEMLREIGYCHGIENYSRHLSGRAPGEPPFTLLDYFPEEFLVIIDESHVTIPQLRGMYEGDRSRKKTLIEHGFRLPSALDNRPLKFSEFEAYLNQVIFTSATPGPYERKKSGQIVEQIIRPTGLPDPEVVVRPAKDQIDNLIKEIKEVLKRKGRILITTLTKKMAEDLTTYLGEKGFKARFLHSEVETLDRIVLLKHLRQGVFDVLVGVNLLREGLDLPEVELVAILDADKEGFLRSETSLIQTIGRAARNVRGKVILYADEVTGSMKRALKETNRRRALQLDYNRRHHIKPQSIKKAIKTIIDHELQPRPLIKEYLELESLEDIPKLIKEKEKEMKEAAKALNFEQAIFLREEIASLKKLKLKK